MKKRKGQRGAGVKHARIVAGRDPDQTELDAVVAAFRRRHFESAELGARSLVRRYPRHPFGWKALGSVFSSTDRPEEAERALLRCLRLGGRDAEVLNSLGNALLALDRPDEALEAVNEALELNPDLHQAHVNRGRALVTLGRYEDALGAYDRALELDNTLVHAHNNRANILYRWKRGTEALAGFDRALALDPNFAEAHYNRANLLRDAGRLEAARQGFQRAVALAPDLLEAGNNLGNVLRFLGDAEGALAAYAEVLKRSPERRSTFSNYLMALNYSAGLSAQEVFEAHCRYPQPEDVPGIRRSIDDEPNRRLRVGLVSADFCLHSVAFFLRALFDHRRANVLELYAYFTGDEPDEHTEWFAERADHWLQCDETAEPDLVARIRDDRIDLLIDLSGHSGQNRLGVFSQRAAPVQITWLGYPNTTGLSAMDYRLVDSITDPPGEADQINTETLIRLPGGFLCYRPLNDEKSLPVANPPCQSRGVIRFGSFNNLAKISTDTVARWSRILEAVPNAKLVLKSSFIGDQLSLQQFTGRLVAQVIAADRIETLGRIKAPEDHLALYNHIDIALDTLPYNGTTTTIEALWMGVPVVTESGDRHAARVGASLLTRMELPELIAQDADEYVRIAVELAKDPERQRRYRATLQARLKASALRDEVGFTRTFEWALREIWRIHCAGEKPRVFEVPSQRDPNRPTPTAAAERALAEGALERLAPTPPIPDAMPSQSPVSLPDTHWTLTIADDVKVCVPPDVKRMTTFVLLEQEDWFEAELPFLRELIEPGMGVLDIGANHGLYALSLAKRLHGQGRVIACEPASAPAGMLERSITENGFSPVLKLLRVGLSDYEGEATLNLGADSELNTLNAEAGVAAGQTEIVRLTTLDALRALPEWPRGFMADIVKLDAEGEEIRILQGGARFFSEQDPLVLFEWKHGNEPNIGLLESFAAFGYDQYRFAPGLNALVPVAPDETLDDYQLNLFACKPSRAEVLRAAGHLLTVADLDDKPRPPSCCWSETMAAYPYVPAVRPDGKALDAWRALDRTSDPHWPGYAQALNAYLSSKDPTQPPSARRAWLRECGMQLDALQRAGDNHLATVFLRIRVLDANGERNASVEANAELVKLMDTNLQARFDRPFVPPLAAFDERPPQGGIGTWLQAAIREGLEIRRAYSSYFHRDPGQLLRLGGNPNRSFEMDRRRALLALAAGQTVQLTADSPLRRPAASNGHRNANWWQRLPLPAAGGTDAESGSASVQ